MSYFEIPEQWHIPEQALRASMDEMAIDGVLGHEGVAMWLGRYEGRSAIVTHVAALRGPGVRKAPDQLLIGPDVINDLTDAAIEHGVVLIGQIHSHGPLYGTHLSLTDKKYGIAVPGYLSAVAPDYAMRPDTRIEDCGIHIFEKGVGWRRLPLREIEQRIIITQGAATTIRVGEA